MVSDRELVSKPRFIIECQHCSWQFDVEDDNDVIALPFECEDHWYEHLKEDE